MSTSIGIPEKRLFRPDEVAKIFDVSVKTVYNWCDSGKLEFLRVAGHTLRIERKCVIEIIRISDEAADT